MKIEKGEKIIVHHIRKGTFNAIAKRSFDTEKDEFFDVVLDQDNLEGQANSWFDGECILCRNSFCEVERKK